ncbi:MAG: hypothetical protein MSA07_04510 [Mucispirillum sp.]|nr:hypothetical protein [Mucispirillum sp.]
MNDSVSTLFSEVNTQKQYFKNSILNSIILYKSIIKDYFKYFLFNLSPLSRYEFWCFTAFSIFSIIFLSSFLFFIYSAVPEVKVYTDAVFFIYIFFILNVSVRAAAARIISVRHYLYNFNYDNNNYSFDANLEKCIIKSFLNIKTFLFSAFFNVLFILLCIINFFINYYSGDFKILSNIYHEPAVYLTIFILHMSFIMYIILMLFPSTSSLEYIIEQNIAYYHISQYYNIYARHNIVDYLTLSAGFLAVISVGHLLIIGFTFSCHIIVCAALLLQSVALLFTGKYFSIIIGIMCIIYFIISIFFMVYNSIDNLYYSPQIFIKVLNYYQVSFALLFTGIFYYAAFDRDILKMSALLGCYLSSLFLWSDYMAIKNILVYDNHTIPVLFYGLVGLVTFFIYLIRVANNKGYYISEEQYLSMMLHDYSYYINQAELKTVYTIIFYSCFAMVLYTFTFFIYPAVEYLFNINLFDEYISSFAVNIRKLITLYVVLGVFLLFKNRNEIFALFLVIFIFILEIYLILYPALKNFFPVYMLYDFQYIYMAMNFVIFILSAYMVRYSRLMALGFSFSIILFALSFINIFNNSITMNNIIVYYTVYAVFFFANILIVLGVSKKIFK